jgi:hypothetical protein
MISKGMHEDVLLISMGTRSAANVHPEPHGITSFRTDEADISQFAERIWKYFPMRFTS